MAQNNSGKPGMKRVLGLDIGGANIKAAHGGGEAWSEPFALWKAPHELGSRLTAMVAAKPSREFDEVRLTMTAELCDCFATKRDGVNAVIDAVVALAGDRPVHTWSTAGCFVTPAQAKEQPLKVAASNWHVLGTFVAKEYAREPGLSVLIDIGSTTTDIMRLRDGGLEPRGLTDFERLASGSLMYTGAWRTPVMAYGPFITLGEGRRGMRMMAEYFASAADVHLLLENIAEHTACMDTADGRSATRANAAARIVRMVGADLEMLTMDDAVGLARVWSVRQRDHIAQAVRDVVKEDRVERFIVSGQGAFIAKDVVEILNHDKAIDLGDTIGREASIAACAWAILRV
jgi:probable H4MPT-linked C1 transfer pathway protein